MDRPQPLTLADLVPGMKVRVRPGGRTWWHPGTRGLEGQVVTVRAREDDPTRVWTDPMAGGIFYVLETPYGFSIAAVVEIVERPEVGTATRAHLPELPGRVLVLTGSQLEQDFPVAPGDRLLVPERAMTQTTLERLTRTGDELLEVTEVRAVAWQVRFKGKSDAWWHTRGFLPGQLPAASSAAAPEPSVPAASPEPPPESSVSADLDPIPAPGPAEPVAGEAAGAAAEQAQPEDP